MESPAQEGSPAPSARGIKAVFAKSRRGKRDNESTTSINDQNEIKNGRGGVRTSIDTALLKLKARGNDDTNSENGDGSSGDTGGAMSKLLPGHRKRRRKRREAQRAEGEAEHPRGRSIGKGDTKSSTYLGIDNPSRSTLNDDDGGSSLLTYDSDIDS